MKLFIGLFLIISAVVSVLADQAGLKIPTLSWGFSLASSAGGLNFPHPIFGCLVQYAGEITAGIFAFLGLWLIISKLSSGPPSPITARKIRRFKSIKRGYYSFLFLLGLGGLAALDQIVVGKEALAVKYEEKWHFPAFTKALEKNKEFGINGKEEADLEPDYRKLKIAFKESNQGVVIMPLWPYAPTNDTTDALAKKIEPKKDRYSGLSTRLYSSENPADPHLRYTYRKGLRMGDAQGWNKDGIRVYKAKYHAGSLIYGSEEWEGEGELSDFLAASNEQEYDVSYPPSEPTLRHPLGTNSKGDDVVAYLYGGLQVNFQAVLFYLPLVYLIGITVGLLMGYFGGWFDLVVQRIIEILSNIPFLFMVMIITLGVPAQYKEPFGFYLILVILVAFGWMGMTYLMRTSALKEKSRDYIAASRVIGAGVPRILFRHLLPNSVAILVTLIPFSVSGLVLSLTALDYLGFGLPSRYASWGKLLQDGLESLSSPLLVTSAFFVLVGLLVLVTFVGEAVREAFDPKKYTYYR